jgi:hypothetical protein
MASGGSSEVTRVPEPPAGAGTGIVIANAPVSYGAFEVTVGHDPNVPSGLSVLDQAAEAGVQAVCDVMEVSAARRRWVAVTEIAASPGTPA